MGKSEKRARETGDINRAEAQLRLTVEETQTDSRTRAERHTLFRCVPKWEES